MLAWPGTATGAWLAPGEAPKSSSALPFAPLSKQLAGLEQAALALVGVQALFEDDAGKRAGVALEADVSHAAAAEPTLVGGGRPALHPVQVTAVVAGVGVFLLDHLAFHHGDAVAL